MKIAHRSRLHWRITQTPCQLLYWIQLWTKNVSEVVLSDFWWVKWRINQIHLKWTNLRVYMVLSNNRLLSFNLQLSKFTSINHLDLLHYTTEALTMIRHALNEMHKVKNLFMNIPNFIIFNQKFSTEFHSKFSFLFKNIQSISINRQLLHSTQLYTITTTTIYWQSAKWFAISIKWNV